jgi:hypothetical protein
MMIPLFMAQRDGLMQIGQDFIRVLDLQRLIFGASNSFTGLWGRASIISYHLLERHLTRRFSCRQG